MRYHLLTDSGDEVAVAEGILTSGITFTVNPPAAGENPIVIHRVAVEDPTGELQDALASALNLPLNIVSPVSLTVTLNLTMGV